MLEAPFFSKELSKAIMTSFGLPNNYFNNRNDTNNDFTRGKEITVSRF